MSELLFVYGTLQFREVQQLVFGRVIIQTAPDLLEGFTRSTIALGTQTYFILVPKEGSSVKGRVLEITLEDLARADEYETDAYRRFRVTLLSGKETWVYGQ